jgi:hypothetical protein
MPRSWYSRPTVLILSKLDTYAAIWLQAEGKVRDRTVESSAKMAVDGRGVAMRAMAHDKLIISLSRKIATACGKIA